MTEHYYSKKPFSTSEQKIIKGIFRETQFEFYTDNGVFSKSEIDLGTQILVDHLTIPQVGRVLDLGCGYGVIGIVLAKFNRDLKIDMVDINERAVYLAGLNGNKNHVAVNVIQADGIEGLQHKYDVIVSNPPIRTGKENIFRLYQEAYTALKMGGVFWIVIGKKQGALSTIRFLETIFQNVEVVFKKKGYFVLKSLK